MDVRELRRHNALKLLKRENVSKSELARILDKSPQHVGVYLRENSTRNIGHAFARQIESAFFLEKGWLDKNHDLEDRGSSLGEPAGNAADAIAKANQASEEFIQARKYWLTTRPQALYMARSELRKLMIEHDVEIQSESDDGFVVLRSGCQLRVDLFVPIFGFTTYRYESTRSMELPDILVLPANKPKASAALLRSGVSLDFYLIPKELLEALPGNTEISLYEEASRVNDTPVRQYLNNFDTLT